MEPEVNSHSPSPLFGPSLTSNGGNTGDMTGLGGVMLLEAVFEAATIRLESRSRHEGGKVWDLVQISTILRVLSYQVGCQRRRPCMINKHHTAVR